MAQGSGKIDPVMRKLRPWFPKIAAALNISAPAPYSWRRVPPSRVIEVARITKMPRSKLRPDLYPKRKKPQNGRS
jgi:hypothetical protein